MTTMNTPNQHKITVDSGPSSKGHGYAVVATRWSLDETAQREKRWVRFETEEEADAEAARLRGASWDEILSWYESN